MGVVPTVKSSGGKTQIGHITRQSRKLARTLFTQPINHIVASSDFMSEFYNNVKERRGVGRSRIAVIRKVFNIMSGDSADKKVKGNRKIHTKHIYFLIKDPPCPDLSGFILKSPF